jgi:hypothetical protein
MVSRPSVLESLPSSPQAAIENPIIATMAIIPNTLIVFFIKVSFFATLPNAGNTLQFATFNECVY